MPELMNGIPLKAGLLASFLHVRLILTSGRQPKHALLSLAKTVVSHIKSASHDPCTC